jgi:glycosyltransferase involved in cell wall biosynthesis
MDPFMQSSRVSIMMPAYNAGLYIEQAIESVLAQSYPHWELIVVNDGSTDQTGEIAARYQDERILLIEQANGGESVARNRALDQMTGEFVAFLDADDMWLPHHLAATVAHLKNHPACIGVYSDGHYCDQQGCSMYTLSSRRRGPFEGWIFEELVRASDVFGPPICVMLRHEIIAQHALRFDPNIVIGPDWDFMIRYAEVGQFGYLNQCTCLYRVHQTNVTVRTDQQRRALYLARCREKAIKRPRFAACTDETRVAVFYDLLVNLLSGHYECQDEATLWQEFKELPHSEQARLLRLMASKSMTGDKQPKYIRAWLARSRTLNPKDLHGAMLHTLFKVSPVLCQSVLYIKRLLEPDRRQESPFGKLI